MTAPCRKVVSDEPLALRIERLERVLGTLLVLLAAQEIIGPEDHALVVGQLRGKAGEVRP